MKTGYRVECSECGYLPKTGDGRGWGLLVARHTDVESLLAAHGADHPDHQHVLVDDATCVEEV